jgi:hypothetical protein
MGAMFAASGTVHLLAEKLHHTSPREGHTLAKFDSTNAVAQLTCRGQLLHLLSLSSAAGSQFRQLCEFMTDVPLYNLHKRLTKYDTRYVC